MLPLPQAPLKPRTLFRRNNNSHFNINNIQIVKLSTPCSTFSETSSKNMGMGIGIDIASVERITQLINRYDRATLNLLFTFDEIDLCQSASNPFQQQLDQIDHVPTPARTSPDEPAFWLYTSGSTGKPKGVVHLHRSMAVCAQEYAKSTMGLHQDDIIYSVAKMPFAYGLGNTLYMPMAVGAASVLTDATNVFDIIADLNRYQPTILFAIPAIYSGIWSVQEMSPLDTSSLKLCISAAEQLPKSLWNKWYDTFGLEICEGIGTSEFLHIFLSNRLGECRPGSCGKPVSGYDVRIVDIAVLICPRVKLAIFKWQEQV